MLQPVFSWKPDWRSLSMLNKLFAIFLLGSSIFAATEDPDKLINRGIALEVRSQFDKALELYALYQETYPFEYRVREAIFRSAEIYRNQKEYREAIRLYSILRNRYPHYEHAREVDYYLADSYSHTGNYARAMRHLRAYEEQFSEGKFSPEIALLKIRIYRDMREFPQLAEAIETLLRTDKTMNRVQRRELEHELTFLYLDRLNNRAAAYEHLENYYRLGGAREKYNLLLERKIVIERFKAADSFFDPSISDIEIDGDDIYIGTFNGGLHRFIRSSGKMEKISLPSPNIRDVYIDSDTIYAATFDGVYIYDKKSSKVTSLKSPSGSLHLAQKVVKDDRYLYFSTLMSGAAKFDIVTSAVENLSFGSFLGTNQVYALSSSPRYLAFGTLDYGAIILDRQTNKKHIVNTEKGLNGNNIKTILIDGRFIWLGVHNGGVFRYDPETENLQKYHWDIRYPSSMAIREAEIFIGTTGEGLWIYNRDTGRMEKLTVYEGLSSDDVQTVRIENDYIWIGYLEKGIDVLYRPLRNVP